jgi:geranylgeranyl diphosphate synthase type II
MTDQLLEPFLDIGKETIDERLNTLLPSSPDLPYGPLFDAARYSLLSSAKRLRPLLVLATAASYGVSMESALDPACALEIVHTYSLIHDDLPSMDDDDFRRGKPTLHKIYPEAHAILTGDYLLTYAFEILAKAPHLSDTQKIQLVRSLATHAGAHGMVGGQVIDLASENKEIDWKTLELMHHYKTGSLLIACLEFGGIIGSAPAADFALLKSIGRNIGIAFQIIDDTLDVTGTLEQMGKPSGSDIAHKKSTALSFLNLEQCQTHAQELLDAALSDLRSLSQPTPLLASLFHRLVDRNC